MTQPVAPTLQLPFRKPSLLGISEETSRLLREQPITVVRTEAGCPAWLVTGYRQVRRLFGDPRLGRSHPDPDNAPRISDSPLLGGPVGDFDAEPDEHRRMRRVLTPLFSARRMVGLAGRITDLADAHLEAMLAEPDRQANLHESLAHPLPIMVICELLGVPVADRGRFRAWSQELSAPSDLAAAGAAFGALHGYMRDRVAHVRDEPGPDALSEMVGNARDLADDELATYAAMLLFAGHETTVSRIDTGTLLLLSQPDRWDALVARPEQVDVVVEEILRLGSSGGGPGLPRYVRDDIEIAGVTLRRGDAVLLDVSAANRDPREFDDPEAFDAGRTEDPHLAFGHGLRYCIGASLARLELQIVFARMVARVPSLRLACPVEQLRLRRDSLTGGMDVLPVTW